MVQAQLTQSAAPALVMISLWHAHNVGFEASAKSGSKQLRFTLVLCHRVLFTVPMVIPLNAHLTLIV